ncbi:hypothetical protein [Pontibaca methylaminivorans]|uniref:hypothetical protein n=1 Tax=Pontibaca methylaminivorans TaxID=515897 RepID=UPI00097656EA|nr:hypothetical protein [Pontibaca methylaminivorans]
MLYTEKQIREQALKALSTAPGGKLTTTQLIETLTKIMKPQGRDAEIIEGRGDTFFSQKVRNLVSHRDDGCGLQASGLAEYNADDEGWTITAKGRAAVRDSNP